MTDELLAKFLAENAKKMTANDLRRIGNIALKAAEEMSPMARKRCADCGKDWADLPSKLCPGCEAYRCHLT